MPHLGAGAVAVLVVAAFLAGAVNAVAGGGSLISFPALLLVGYSPLSANVTNAVALLPGYAGGSWAYRRELRGQAPRMAVLGAVSVAGAVAGAVALVKGPPALFGRIVPWLILLSCALLAAQPALGRWLVTSRAEGEEHRAVWLLGAQAASGAYGAYFGAGLGVVMLGVLGIAIPDDLQRLNALKGVLSLVINAVAVAYFTAAATVAWPAVGVMVVASLVGGQSGVALARRLSAPLLRVLVIAFGTAVGVRLLL